MIKINPVTGLHASGYRFRLNCRPISRRALFIPLSMKQNECIRLILEGVHPCVVFNVDSIVKARWHFNQIRKKYDFNFWAATDYTVRDINDPDSNIAFILNRKQNRLISILEERFFDRLPGRYIIFKRPSRIGLTTCIQAYIIWRQLYRCAGNANICAASEFNLLHMRANFARFFKREIVHKEKWLRFPDGNNALFLNSFANPDAPRGIDFHYVHMADMSKWKDPSARLSRRAYIANISGILPDHTTLIILEGNRPSFDIRTNDISLLYDEKVKYALRPPSLFTSELLCTLLHRHDNPFLTPIEL